MRIRVMMMRMRMRVVMMMRMRVVNNDALGQKQISLNLPIYSTIRIYLVQLC